MVSRPRRKLFRQRCGSGPVRPPEGGRWRLFPGSIAVRSRAIYGCAGPILAAGERSFFRDARPWGFILFARNIKDPTQVRELVQELRETVDDGNTPVLIDQEGGRVARLKPPHWSLRLPAARFGVQYARNPEAAREATYLNARLIAND